MRVNQSDLTVLEKQLEWPRVAIRTNERTNVMSRACGLTCGSDPDGQLAPEVASSDERSYTQLADPITLTAARVACGLKHPPRLPGAALRAPAASPLRSRHEPPVPMAVTTAIGSLSSSLGCHRSPTSTKHHTDCLPIVVQGHAPLQPPARGLGKRVAWAWSQPWSHPSRFARVRWRADHASQLRTEAPWTLVNRRRQTSKAREVKASAGSNPAATARISSGQ